MVLLLIHELDPDRYEWFVSSFSVLAETMKAMQIPKILLYLTETIHNDRDRVRGSIRGPCGVQATNYFH